MLLEHGGVEVTSAHFSYYSVFLLMKYLLHHYMGDCYENQEQETKGRDSHKILSDKVLLNLASSDVTNVNDYITFYNHLNNIRRKADYVNEPIPQAVLEKSKDNAQEFFDKSSQLYNFVV